MIRKPIGVFLIGGLLLSGCHEERVIAFDPDSDIGSADTATDTLTPEDVSVESCEGCVSGERCVDSACVCQEDLSRCGEVCVDLNSDREHCGQCGEGCAVACYEGQCVMDSCEQISSSFDGCGAQEGSCVSIEAFESHPLHCGRCDSPCLPSELCLDGECVGVHRASTCDTCPCAECEERLCCVEPENTEGILCLDGASSCPD